MIFASQLKYFRDLQIALINKNFRRIRCSVNETD